MKIVFGLGNVGREYENTRHNMGFMFLDYLYPNISYKKKFDGMYAEIIIDNEKVLLVKPCKYMNLSGEVVSSYINYYKVDLDDVFVIHDDLDMNLGTFKLTYNHSSGGHNGIKNIFNNINSNHEKYFHFTPNRNPFVQHAPIGIRLTSSPNEQMGKL